MTDDNGLAHLIERGPCPDRELRHLVMTRYAAIQQARRLAWSWVQIAGSLGMDPKRARALAAAFVRVRRGIESGRLAVPGQAQPKHRPTQKEKPPEGGEQAEIESVINQHLIK